MAAAEIDTGSGFDLVNRFCLVASVFVLVSAAAAFLPHTNWLWGVNLGGFYPVPARVAWILLFLAAIAAVCFLPRASSSAAVEPEGDSPDDSGSPPALPGSPALWGGLAAVTGGALFHLLRARSFLLGDGTHIVIHLARNEPPAPRAALYNILETELTTLLRGSRTIPTLAEAGFLSTLVGALFMGIAVWILARRARSVSPASAVALGALVFLQPSMQLYFGYVEAYALVAAPLMLFFLLAFDVAEKRRNVWILAVPAVLALAAHPFGATVLPAFLLLLVRANPRTARRRLGVILGAAVVLTVALYVVFQIWPAWRSHQSPVQFLAPQNYGSLLENVIRNILKTPHWSRLYSTASPEHWADVANHIWLTAAPALVVLLSLALTRSGRRALRTFPVLVAAAGTFGVLLLRMFLRTVLGAVRDWDLFAVTGIGMTAMAATALALWVEERRTRAAAIAGSHPDDPKPRVGDPAVARILVGTALISLFFLAPWLGLQTDIERAAQRHLAIVDGRPELEPIVAGDFHAAMGDRLFYIGQFALAGRAYDRAYKHWPTYTHTLRAGQSYLAAGQLERSVVAMHRALTERPDDRTAMTELGNILNGLNAFDLADSVLNRAIVLFPDAPLPRVHRTRTLAMLGRERDARAMLESARPLVKPGEAAYRDFTHLDSLLTAQ